MKIQLSCQRVAAKPDLPESMQVVAEVIGEDATMNLVARWPLTPRGCISIYVPERMPETHRLVQIIGLNPARLLSMRFAGEIIKLAAGGRLRSRQRRADMRSMVVGGASLHAVARLYAVSERTVRRACEGVRRGARNSGQERS